MGVILVEVFKKAESNEFDVRTVVKWARVASCELPSDWTVEVSVEKIPRPTKKTRILTPLRATR